MDDLHGSAAARLNRLDDVAASGTATAEWLERNLRATLEELARVEPIADADQERRQDY